MAKGKLLALILLVGSVSLVAATGAFTTITAERTATISVSGDDQALLALDPSDETDLVSLSDDGTIQINLDDSSGAGLNPVAKTTFDPAMNMTNQGTQEVGITVDVSIDESQLDTSDVNGYSDSETLAEDLEESVVFEAYNLDNGTLADSGASEAVLAGGGASDTVILSPGDTATIAVSFDLTDGNGAAIPELSGNGDISIAITIEADSDNT